MDVKLKRGDSRELSTKKPWARRWEWHLFCFRGERRQQATLNKRALPKATPLPARKAVQAPVPEEAKWEGARCSSVENPRLRAVPIDHVQFFEHDKDQPPVSIRPGFDIFHCKYMLAPPGAPGTIVA